MKALYVLSNHTNAQLLSVMRYILLVPIIYSLLAILYIVLAQGYNPTTYQFIGENMRVFMMTSLALFVTFGLGRLEKNFDVHLPQLLLVVIMIFIASALVIGDGFGTYIRFWWWDDALHTLSGIITTMTGFLLIYFFNARYNMRMNPTFVALFSFSFAIMMAVLWEIFEFVLDVLFAADMQGWRLPPDTILIGKSFQGSGLRDTMSDLIVACVGAFVTSVVVFFSYKNERKRVLKVMRRTFPSRSKRKTA